MIRYHARSGRAASRALRTGLAEGAGESWREVRIPGEGRLALCSFDGGHGLVCAVARVLSRDTAAYAAPRPLRQESESFA